MNVSQIRRDGQTIAAVEAYRRVNIAVARGPDPHPAAGPGRELMRLVGSPQILDDQFRRAGSEVDAGERDVDTRCLLHGEAELDVRFAARLQLNYVLEYAVRFSAHRRLSFIGRASRDRRDPGEWGDLEDRPATDDPDRGRRTACVRERAQQSRLSWLREALSGLPPR